jgi:acyl carrier protein
MEKDEILSQLQPIFRDVFDLPDFVLTPESNAADIEEWDSLTHVNLVVAVEQHFGIRFALGELHDLQNVGEMAELIQKKLALK